MFFIFHFSFFIFQSCGLDVEDPTPLSPPQWVPKSLPEEWPERGIDAHETGGIYLEWEYSESNTYIGNIYLYRASLFDNNDSIGSFKPLASVIPDGSNVGTYVDQSVYLDTTYFYKLKAEDNSGNISSFSDSALYRLMRAIRIDTMIPNGSISVLPLDRKLMWQYDYHVFMENYCLTLLDAYDSLIVRVIFPPENYTGSDEYWIIPRDIHLVIGSKYYWRVDLEGSYINNRETTGSESLWASFVYTGS